MMNTLRLSQNNRINQLDHSKDDCLAQFAPPSFLYFVTISALLFVHLFLNYWLLSLRLVLRLFLDLVVVDFDFLSDGSILSVGSRPLPAGAGDGGGAEIKDGGGLELGELGFGVIGVKKGIGEILLSVFLAEQNCVKVLRDLLLSFLVDDIVNVSPFEFSPSLLDFRPQSLRHC